MQPRQFGFCVLMLAFTGLMVANAMAAEPSVWLKNGAPAGPDPSRAQAGGLAVMLISTTNPDKLVADWNQPKPGAQLTVDRQTVRHRPIFTFILFQGCKADAKGACNVTADFETRGPSGKSYDQTKGGKVWVGRLAPPANSLQLSEGALGIEIEDRDRLGAYRVDATVTDHVSGVTLHVQNTFTAAAN